MFLTRVHCLNILYVEVSRKWWYYMQGISLTTSLLQKMLNVSNVEKFQGIGNTLMNESNNIRRTVSIVIRKYL